MSMVIAAFAISARDVHIAGNGTTGSTVAWVSSPNQRGTFDLVQSCLLTLVLCVWTAMHLNIPPHGEREWKSWRSYMKWSLLGVFGPELIIYIAWMQNNSARMILSEIKNNFDVISSKKKRGKRKKDAIPEKDRKFPSRPAIEWTMTHSFYAASGGFYFENDHSSPGGGFDFLPPEHERFIITSRGMGLLARCGYAPDITIEEIEDKNKSDWITKSIVVLQAAWFLAQILSRVKVGLPVTLLEINTIGHVICVFVIYVLWWYKPRMVREPTKLEGEWVRPMVAYMYMCSRISGPLRPGAGIADVFNNVHKIPEISGLAYFAPNPSLEAEVEPKQVSSSVTDSSQSSMPDDIFTGGHFALKPKLSGAGDLEKGSIRLSRTSTELQQARWRCADDALRQHPQLRASLGIQPAWIPKSIPNPSGPGSLHYLEPPAEQYVAKYVGNWDIVSLMKWRQTKIMGMFFWTSSIVFGAVHISAWNAEFPTIIEAWMWRCSALWIAFSGCLWFMISFLGLVSEKIDDFWTQARTLVVAWYWKAILGFLCGVCGAMWIGARMFLVVESFVSIRRLPAEAYDTPDWTEVFPHL